MNSPPFAYYINATLSPFMLIKHNNSAMVTHSPLLILAVTFFLFSLISPSISQTCSTQNILTSERTPFESCLDLPVLDSYLHYTYNATNSSLSIAFIATPSQTNGWIAWAINPTELKMSGSQAFLAFRSGTSSVPVVKTYNITSYSSLVEGKLDFDFWNLRAVSMSGGRIAIFTSVKVPAGEDSVNQVWQIGGSVTNGRPGVHAFAPANLESTAVLKLTGTGTADAPSFAPALSPGGYAAGPGIGGQAGGPGNVGSLSTNINFGVLFGVLVLLGTIFIF